MRGIKLLLGCFIFLSSISHLLAQNYPGSKDHEKIKSLVKRAKYTESLTRQSQYFIKMLNHNLMAIDQSDFASLRSDFQSPTLSLFLQMIQGHYQQLQEMKTLKHDIERPIIKEALAGLANFEEESFNQLNPWKRNFKIIKLVNEFIDGLDKEKSNLRVNDNKNMIFKSYLKKIRPQDEKFAAFVEQIPSFTDQEKIKKMLQDKAEYANIIFYKTKDVDGDLFDSPEGKVKASGPAGPFTYGIKMETIETLNLSFAPLDVLQEILKKYHVLSSYQTSKRKTSATDPWEINLWITKKGTADQSQKANKILKRASLTLMNKDIFLSSATLSLQNPLTLKIFDGPNQKIIPQKERGSVIFNIKDTNSAQQSGNEISIIREEELLKTLTHEIYHHLQVDLPFRNEYISELALQNFAIERIDQGGRPLLNEALTEALALISHISMTAVEMAETYPDHKMQDKSVLISELAKDMWQKEKTFSLFQSAKLLFLSGFENFEEFLNPKKHKIRIKESTSTAEYHIIKSLLIYDIEALLAIVIKRKNNHPLQLETDLINLLLLNARNFQLSKDMNSLLSLFGKHQKEGNKQFFSDPLFQNQRMSLIEPLL